jgi:hypothetical protein
MARKFRLRLLGDGWHAFGSAEIPENREIVVTEAEAAAFLKHRGSRHSVEVIEIFDDDTGRAERRA